jgi:signal peptide peptidase SppA
MSLAEFISAELWAIDPARLGIYQAVAAGVTNLEVQASHRAPEAVTTGRTAVIPIMGPIVHRANIFTEIFGGASTNRAVRDDSIERIVLDIDSPGGTVSGVDELANEIRAARNEKTIIAHAHPMAASAAFWIGAQASEFRATADGLVGSVGVFSVHEDVSKALEKAGISVEIIKAGKHKAEGNPFEPLSAADRDAIQARVDSAMDSFVNALAAGRGVSAATVRADFGEGRVLTAQDALSRGMIDKISTLGETLTGSRDELRAASTIRDLEATLRDAGISKNDARAIASNFQPKSERRDAVDWSFIGETLNGERSCLN